MHERRIYPRAACRLHCRIKSGKKQIRARIVDVSEGGLCFYSPVRLESKTMIEITIDVPGLSESSVTAEVWHVRQQKILSSSRRVWVVGVMVAEKDDAYLNLLSTAGLKPEAEAAESFAAPQRTPTRLSVPAEPPTSAPTAPSSASTSTATATATASASASASASSGNERSLPKPRKPEAPYEGEPRIFRVRVQARTGPRTRLLTLTARSKTEAEQMASEDLTPEWRIIEVQSH